MRENALIVCRNALAVIWDMHVFINQLIECDISLKRNFYMDWNFKFLFCYLAARGLMEAGKDADVVVEAWRLELTRMSP